MRYRDKYINFARLAEIEREGSDFSIEVSALAGSDIAIMAPHGGKIEFLTNELASAIAGDDFSFYAFIGTKVRHNRSLHITSTNFDEPRALCLAKSCNVVLTIHGLSGDGERIEIGGLNVNVRDSVNASLRAADFDINIAKNGAYSGTEVSNICNKGKSRAGVQLEIQAGLRSRMSADADAFDAFVAAVRAGITAQAPNST
ncbi:MAG: poly-gamma-glutamate hydrolase family protein [Polymorphobacter sp.]